MKTRQILLLALSGAWLAGCATGPVQDPPPAAATVLEAINVDVGGGLPVRKRQGEPVLASRMALGGDDLPLHYRVSYVVEPGDVFAGASAPPGTFSPQHFGRQRIGHDAGARLPPMAGAPLRLRVTTESWERWSVDGTQSSQQRQLADLEWAPGPAKLNLQWAGGTAASDSQLALLCDVRGAMQVPLATAAAAPWLRFTGRSCQLHSSHARYSAVSAETWGVAMGWNHGRVDSELLFTAVEPDWRETPEQQPIDTGYELGLRHRLDHGDWTARAQVAMRRATAWDLAQGDALERARYAEADTHWVSSVSLARELSAFSVSAQWAQGADPMWFMPQIGQRSDRFDLRLDLSRLLASVAPESAPQLSMQYQWNQARFRNQAVSSDGLVSVKMALSF
jgi:hypothetical protein